MEDPSASAKSEGVGDTEYVDGGGGLEEKMGVAVSGVPSREGLCEGGGRKGGGVGVPVGVAVGVNDEEGVGDARWLWVMSGEGD